MGFRSEDEAQRAKLDALQQRVAELEEKLEEDRSTPVQPAAEPSKRDTAPREDAAKEPGRPKSYQRVPLVTRWLVVAVILVGGPAIRGCTSEPMALPALWVACPAAETLSADVRSGGMVPSSSGGYSEALETTWTCDSKELGFPRAAAGSIGWALLAGGLFLLLAAAMSILPKAAWPLPALLAMAAGAGHAWGAWQVDAPVGTWAAAGEGSLLVWGLLILAGASVSACADLGGPEGDDPSVGSMLGALMLFVGVMGAVPVFNVLVALGACAFALMHVKRPLLARIAMASVAPAMVAVPWGGF